MKRLLSLALAIAMVLSVGAIAASAATEADYPVSHIWKYGFLKDDDGYLDLNNRTYVVPYGKTVYFPLINEKANSSGSDSADAAAKEKAYNDAKAAYDTAAQAEADAKDKLDKANSDLTAAKKALEDAQSGASQNEALAKAFDDAIAAAEKYKTAAAEKAAAQSKLNSIEQSLVDWGNRVTTLNAYTDENIAAYLTAYYAEGATDDTKANAVNMVSALNTINGTTLSLDTYTSETIEDAKTAVKNAVAAAKALCSSKIGTEADAADQNGSFYAQKAYYTQQKSDAEAKENSAASDVKAKLSSINNTYKLSVDVNETDPDAIRSMKKANAGSGTPADLDSLRKAVDQAQAKVNDLQDTYNTAKSAASTKKSAMDTAYTAWQNALKNVDSYVFVYESDAVANAKVKATWDIGKKYVDSVEIERIRAISNTYGLGTTYTGSKQKIYCVAVTFKESNSTNDQDVEGEIGISKSGTNGFSYSDTRASISVTLTFPESESGNQKIPTTPTLFSAGHGFKAESDHTFYFEADKNSYFEVNTSSQKDIVLAFDTDYDDKLADKILKKTPNADLDFYNGNYARFSKTGTLNLSYPDKKAYVYKIDSDGNLTRISNNELEYDEYDETFSFKTNTLGRYVISTKSLSASISASSSSSSASSSKAPTASSVKPASSSTTVIKSSTTAPASSTVTPSSSSKPASSSSSTTSSSSESESSEPLSIEEPSSESSEDQFESVIINTDDDDDVPSKKGGVSWLVWLLIIAGLVAVLIAVGVIFYTRKNSGKRMI